MENFNRFIDAFVNGDLFLLFIIVMIIILFVLLTALFKTKNDHVNLSVSEDFDKEENEGDAMFKDLIAKTSEDRIKEDEPLIKQVKIPTIETYDDEIENYENSEEENAVISADELAKRKEERMNELGINDSKAIIQKYEEEQEKKAIISYEQLLKNASNITLTYKEEEVKKGAPRVNKIEIKEKEVTPAESYIDEEEFLKILKEFRLNL